MGLVMIAVCVRALQITREVRDSHWSTISGTSHSSRTVVIDVVEIHCDRFQLVFIANRNRTNKRCHNIGRLHGIIVATISFGKSTFDREVLSSISFFEGGAGVDASWLLRAF
tara:strand:- start:1078 stop:1413 length:336 start_codon:yes stop_codon:yes gene_type:complete